MTQANDKMGESIDELITKRIKEANEKVDALLSMATSHLKEGYDEETVTISIARAAESAAMTSAASLNGMFGVLAAAIVKLSKEQTKD